MVTNEFVQLHSGREVIYACLSRIFIDKASETFYEMLDIFITSISFMEHDECLQKSVKQLSAFMEEYKKLSADELVIFNKDMARTYTTLYCLSNSVPISESVYTSPEGLAMQASSEKTTRTYRQYAFNMKHYSNEPSDHISYELMFMSYLAKQTVKLISENETEKASMLVTVQIKFIEEHLSVWAKHFSNGTNQHPAAEKFYGPASCFMTNYLDGDRNLLEYLTKSPCF